ncbi:MAG: SIMPL domain-containing protein [Acidobacteriaceae bacterium]|jgi:uncharacterized protein YggE|nr:SIMPL domain-containing protein [Acidobacteriaceae bacterium]
MFRTAAVLIVSMLAVSSVSAQDAGALSIPTIVTTGEAVIRRAPDQAFVTLAVETRAKSPRDAQRMNADTMAGVQQKLTAAGLSKDVVRTTGYSINQEFDYTNGRRVPGDYVAHNGFEVRLDAVDRVGEVIDAAVSGGATNVTGIRFDLKDRVTVERAALRQAVEDARARADALAAGARRTVDRVLRIDDSRPMPRVPSPAIMAGMVASPSPASAPTSIDSGFVEVHAQVVLTVAIR